MADNLFTRIAQLFGRGVGPVQGNGAVATAPVRTPPTPSVMSAAGIGQQFEQIQLNLTRRDEIRTCDSMYRNDPRIEGAINTLARDVARGGVQIRVEDNSAAQEVADALITRIGFNDHVDDFIRETFIEGDSFLENGVNADLDITEVNRKPTIGMNRFTDKNDRFVDPAHAYWYSKQYYYTDAPPPDALWFAQWQVIHARWGKRATSRYGRPLFASGIGAWKRVVEGELDISVRRRTRAGMRFFHVVEGADENGIEAYRERNKAALGSANAAVTDFFSNKAGAITAVQGDARLADIQDVLHHIETLWTASPVPLALVGYGQQLNRDILEQKLTQYDRSLEQLTNWAEAEFVRPLFELQWLLKGILPQSLRYEVHWKSKTPTNAADLRNIADALLRLRALGMPPELTAVILDRYLPWLNVDVMLQANPQSELDIAKLAASAAQLAGGF